MRDELSGLLGDQEQRAEDNHHHLMNFLQRSLVTLLIDISFIVFLFFLENISNNTYIPETLKHPDCTLEGLNFVNNLIFSTKSYFGEYLIFAADNGDRSSREEHQDIH